MANRRRVTIDFETFSEADIGIGSWAYAEHPSTKVLCMGFQFEEDEGPSLWVDPEVEPDVCGSCVEDNFLKGGRWEGEDPPPWEEARTEPPPSEEEIALHIEAHNAEFERAIWETIMVPLYGFTKDVTWECTAARAAAMSLPRKLDDVNQVLGIDVQKDKEGHFLMMKMCKPRKPTKADPRENWLDDEEKLERLYEYCLQDVRAEVALSKVLRELNAEESEIWRVDQEINKRGIRFDPELVKAGMLLWETKKEEIHAQISDATDGVITGGLQHGRFLKWAQKWFPDLESVGKEPLKDLLARDDVPDELRALFALRAEANKTSCAKFKALWIRKSEDGRVRSMYMYHGASTGRWTGKGMQMHNLPVGRGLDFDHELCVDIAKLEEPELFSCLYSPSMSYLSACIRQCFIPKEGHIFACADYAAIEARALLWLVNDKGLQMFRDGIDPYEALAAKIYAKEVEDVTPDERQLGKQGVLGLGFRMGVDRFVKTCHQYGIEIDAKMSQRVIDIYRGTFTKVPAFWDDIDAAAKECIRTRKPVRCGRVVWGMKGNFLHCSLPSGRLLSYFRPCIKDAETPWGEMRPAVHFYGPRSEGGWGFQHSHGGVFTENIVQAIARDILAEAIVRLEDYGFPVVLHTHDEALCEMYVPGFREREKADFERLMSQVPKWAPDLPIAIDAWYGYRYRK